EDLYYRLNVIPLTIPNLKVRLEDIPLIISHKLKSLAEVHQIEEKTIDEKIIREFYLYDWPGNIRELFNMLERLFVLTSGRHIYLIKSNKLRRLAEVHQIEEKTIDEKIIREFYLYDWPGNIRELFNMLERLFVLTSGRHIYYEDFIKLIDLQPSYLNEELFNHSYGNSKQNYEMNEVNTIKQALADTKGNKTDAAKKLGVSRATLYNKLNRYRMN